VATVALAATVVAVKASSTASHKLVAMVVTAETLPLSETAVPVGMVAAARRVQRVRLVSTREIQAQRVATVALAGTAARAV
jgi:hypothetical protein